MSNLYEFICRRSFEYVNLICWFLRQIGVYDCLLEICSLARSVKDLEDERLKLSAGERADIARDFILSLDTSDDGEVERVCIK